MSPDLQTVVCVTLILAVAALFKSLAGFGFSLCAAPLLTLLLPPEQAVPILVTVEVFVGIWLWYLLDVCVDLKRIGLLFTAACAGLIAGTAVLQVADQNLLRVLVGIGVLVTAGFLWTGKRLPVGSSAAGSSVTGLCSGLLGGTTAMSGPPIIIFFDATEQNSAAFRANCIAYFTLTYVAHFFWLAGQGRINGKDIMIDSAVLIYGGVAIPATWAVLYLSRHWHRRLDGPRFRRLTLALLTFAGLSAAGLGALNLLRSQ